MVLKWYKSAILGMKNYADIKFKKFIPTCWRNYQCPIVTETYGLLHIDDFCLRFSLASDGFSKGILL